MRIFIISILLVFCGGCAAPRVFQSKVPAPLVASENQLEAQRGAADLIARKIETPVELKPVAMKLSASLGAPAKPFDMPTVAASAQAASSSLDRSMVEMQHKLDLLNAKLTKLQGKDIEGTGISLLGPGMTAIVVGLVALAVLCPPALTFLMFAYRRLKTTAGMVVEQIEQAAEAPETKDAVEKIKGNLSSVMDHLPTKQGKLHREVIKKLKTA